VSGLLDRFLAPTERKVITDDSIMALLGGTGTSKAGVVVDAFTALRVSTTFACVRAVAEDVAQLPLKLLREEKSGRKTPAYDHRLYDIVSVRPNAYQTSHGFREMLSMHASLLRGGYAWINRVTRGVEELLPLAPGVVTARQGRDWTVYYSVSLPNGKSVEVAPDDILRIEGPSWYGYGALQLLDQAREAMGLSIATEEAQAKLHANGVQPSGLLSRDGEMKKEQKERVRDLIAQAHAGAENRGKLLILDQGFKFQQFTMSGVDAQTLESRRYQVEEIARMFGVPPLRIGYSDKASTYASAEQFALQYVRHTIGPWVNRWEQALSLALLTEPERRAGYFFHFVLDGLLRGDWSARSVYFKAALGTASSPGWMSPNDVRRLEDLDPSDQEGADDIITPEDMAGKEPPVAPPTEPPSDPNSEPSNPADPGED